MHRKFEGDQHFPHQPPDYGGGGTSPHKCVPNGDGTAPVSIPSVWLDPRLDMQPTRKSWECHKCQRVNAPHVDQCPCSTTHPDLRARDVTWYPAGTFGSQKAT